MPDSNSNLGGDGNLTRSEKGVKNSAVNVLLGIVNVHLGIMVCCCLANGGFPLK